jgi:TonB family protein
MRGFILFLVCARAGIAQSGPDGAPLLQAIADSFRNLTSYHAEGQISADLGIVSKTTFRLATVGQRLRIDAGGEDWATGLSVTAVCDGSTGWASFEEKKNYVRIAKGDREEGFCSRGTLAGFEHLADNLRSAAITGTSQAQFEGRQRPCVVVEAKYRQIRDVTIAPGLVGTIGRSTRRLCIDEARKLVLTDHIEAALEAGPHPSYLVVDVTYDRIERNAALPPTLFDLQPPQGYTEIARPVQPPAPPYTPLQPRRGLSFGASAIGEETPEYTQEAWDEGIQGQVSIVARIATDGAVESVRVTQPIGWGLDEKAMECVRKWRFNPASQDGVAVVGEATAIVRFVLPDKRPEQPSVGAVPKPVLPGLLPLVELRPPTELENFFYVVGVNFHAPAVCERIGALVMGSSGGFSGQGFQVQDLRSECYEEMSRRVHDPKLCEHVTPLRISGLDGSGLDKENCLKQLYGLQTIVSPFDYAVFARFVQELGYDDAGIARSPYKLDPFEAQVFGSKDEAYWGFVSNLSGGAEGDRAEFIARVMRLQ